MAYVGAVVRRSRLACAAFAGLFVAACAGGDQEGSGRGPGSGGAGGGAATGGSGGTTPIDFGNDPTGGSGGTAVTPPPAPVVDPSAPDFTQDDTGMSGLDQATIDMLKAGGGSCATSILYPYANTVFPGGLEPPIIMWGTAADAAYVRFAYAQSTAVSYEFAAGASNPGEIQIPRTAWDEITRRTNNAPLEVTLNILSGGSVTSCTTSWKIAADNMRGAVYYNTYQAPGGAHPENGAVMRLTLGGGSEIYKQYTGALSLLPSTGPCYSCHSVSFDGSTMVASYHDYTNKVFEVEKYDVTANTEPPAAGMVHNANFGALTPDGTRILAMGNPSCTGGADTFPRAANNFQLVEGPAVARMLDTNNGADTNASGLDAMNYMWMPQFSPDGDQVVFTHAKPDGAGGTDRRELAIATYDYATNTFGLPQVIASNLGPAPSLLYSPAPALGGAVPCGEGGCTPTGAAVDCNILPPPLFPGDVGALPTGSCSEPCYPAWPFFTPDGKGVVFSLISEPDFATAFPGRGLPSKSELWYVDLETLEMVEMVNANTGNAPADLLANYYPTVMPVTVGGYFWVYWTARRNYGHKLMPTVTGDTYMDAYGKRIWVAALTPKQGDGGDVSAPGPLTDPSHPGFYLTGQSDSGNVRAFVTLNPCLEDGLACASGLDCCCGYCGIADGATGTTCGCEPPPCSKKNEKCEEDSDCCPPDDPATQPQNRCIGGFCNFIVPQ